MFGLLAGVAHAGQIALDVSQKYGDTHIAEGLSQYFQRDRFAGAGGARDQTVTVGHGGLQINGSIAGGEPDFGCGGKIHNQ